jgi:colanic acid/amylovoran biosynthesis glycosyltransferase
MPLRIAYVAEIFPSQSETWVHHEIQELQRLGCVIRVFATHPRPDKIPEELRALTGITTYMRERRQFVFWAVGRVLRRRLIGPVLRGLLFDARTLRLKAQVVRDMVYAGDLYPDIQAFRPDVLIAHFAGTRTNIALFYSLLSGVPFLFKMHAADVFRRVALLRLKMSRAAQVLTISDYNIAFIRERYPDVAARQIRKHACGIPIEAYKFQDPVEPNDIATVVGVGRLVRMKGFDVLIQASKVLRDRGFRCRVVIMGDGPERQSLERLRDHLDVSDTVTLSGYASPEAVKSAVLAASVFALPAVWDPVQGTQDGIPVALMEAMALGVPVVTTRTSGIPELVQDGVSGFLVAPRDEDALATAIMRSCTLGMQGRRELASSARQMIVQNHNASKLADELLTILQDSVRNNRTAPAMVGSE